VNLTIYFDCETNWRTIKIEHIGTGWMLTAETDTIGLLAELLPKQHLS